MVLWDGGVSDGNREERGGDEVWSDGELVSYNGRGKREGGVGGGREEGRGRRRRDKEGKW